MRQLLVATSDQPRVRRLELRVRPVSATRNAEENDGIDAAGARLTEAPLSAIARSEEDLEDPCTLVATGDRAVVGGRRRTAKDGVIVDGPSTVTNSMAIVTPRLR